MRESTLGPVEVSTRLGLGKDHQAWLGELAAVGQPPDPTPRYPRQETVTRLRELGLSESDAAEAAAFTPAPERDPELWWLLDRCRHLLIRGMGTPGPMWHWPSLPAALGARGRWFFVHVFLAATPAVRTWNQTRGIPVDVVLATLAALGEQVGLHRVIHGVGGLDQQSWLTLHYRGAIHRLGALQFERVDLASGMVPGVEGAVLALHIPDGGPLTAPACDDSLRQARMFFPAHFPQWPHRRGVCVSWLLDPQLAEYLDPGCDIMRFQRRFSLAPPGVGGLPGDKAIVEFVFRKTDIALDTDTALDELPRLTTLQRAVADHLRAGRHWRMHPGWLPLD